MLGGMGPLDLHSNDTSVNNGVNDDSKLKQETNSLFIMSVADLRSTLKSTYAHLPLFSLTCLA